MGASVPAESEGDRPGLSREHSLAFGRVMSRARLSFVPQIANHESKITPRRTVG